MTQERYDEISEWVADLTVAASMDWRVVEEHLLEHDVSRAEWEEHWRITLAMIKTKMASLPN